MRLPVRGFPRGGRPEVTGKVAARLQWHLRNGHALESLALEAARGRPRQSWLEYLALPELGPDEAWLEACFQLLSGARRSGWSGPEPIQASEVLALLQIEGIVSPEERRSLVHAIRHLDDLVLRHTASKRKKT
jgi:hypothetical protein